MISANLRLVVAMCRGDRSRIEYQQLEMLDLLQVGNGGLIRTVEKFDPSRGYKLSTYASFWIRESVQRYIQGFGSTIKIPAQVQRVAYRASLLQASTQQILSNLEMAECLCKLARQLAMSLQVVAQCGTISLDPPLASSDGEGCHLFLVSDGTILGPEDDYLWLHDHVRTLGATEQQLLLIRYGSQEFRSL
ncbi:MAG: sigma factor [Cyanobacteriota bacterium]